MNTKLIVGYLKYRTLIQRNGCPVYSSGVNGISLKRNFKLSNKEVKSLMDVYELGSFGRLQFGLSSDIAFVKYNSFFYLGGDSFWDGDYRRLLNTKQRVKPIRRHPKITFPEIK